MAGPVGWGITLCGCCETGEHTVCGRGASLDKFARNGVGEGMWMAGCK